MTTGAAMQTQPSEPGPAAPLVFITGASSGLGQAMAAYYAGKGWRLALVARRLEQMQSWQSELGLSAAQCTLYQGDVSQPGSIRAIALQCIAQQGLPDVVIANAGISCGVDTSEWEDLQTLQQIWQTNNLGLAATLQPFISGMRQRRSGTLVGIASVAGVRGLPGHAGYCASKAGVLAYCESLRGDLRGSGVAVTTISPGFVATPMTAGNPFPMPFLMPATAFAEKAAAAIGRRRSHVVIPWQMGCLAWLLRRLPDAVFDMALAGRGQKPRAGQREP